MLRTIIQLFIGNSFDWRFWGNLAKLLIILLCITIIIVISWRKANNTFCNTCDRRVKHFHKYCDYCGKELTSNNKNVIIGINKKTRIVSGLTVSILSIMIVFSIYQVAASFKESSYATGMYTDYNQTYIKADDTWGIECEKALTNGSFHQAITLSNLSNKVLYIESKSSFGTLILNITQGDRNEQVDISNTNGVIMVDLSAFDTDLKIDLSVEHTKVENVQFKMNWE